MVEIRVPSKVVMVPVEKITPYVRNPRKNSATVEKLAELIKQVGFNVPLVLDRQNVIVKGHTRWKAGLQLGMPKLPCIYTDNDEETNKLDRLADNRVQEFSLWNDELLNSELASLNLDFDFDLSALNFDIDLGIEGYSETARTDPPSADAAPISFAEPVGSEERPAPKQEGPAAPAIVANPDYVEVVCDQCGHHLFVKK